MPFEFFKQHPNEIRDRQERIIGNMPIGANSEIERKEYATFLLNCLEAGPIQSQANRLLVKEIERTDCSMPAPSLYRRLSLKTLLALDEKRMWEDPRATDKKEQPKAGNSQNVAKFSDCPCQNKEYQGYNPIACFVRAAQEQVGAENVVISMKGDVSTLSLSKKQPFPWDQLVSLESSICADNNVLKNTTPDALLDKVMIGFQNHAKNWGNLLWLHSWFVFMPGGKEKVFKIPFDIGPSDVVGFDDLFGNIVTTTGHFYGSDEALGRMAASMAKVGMGRNYHVMRTVNLYKHTLALARAWSEIKQPHPDILKGWEKLTSPAYSYLLLMLANGLKGS